MNTDISFSIALFSVFSLVSFYSVSLKKCDVDTVDDKLKAGTSEKTNNLTRTNVVIIGAGVKFVICHHYLRKKLIFI